MIKSNVTIKLFFAILAANSIIVISMFLIMQWNMDRGFLRYINQLEQSRLEYLASKLGMAYAAAGNWDFIKKTPEALSQMIAETIAEYPPFSHSRTLPPPRRPRFSKQPPPPRPQVTPPMKRFESRIVLLDAAHNLIFGITNPSEIEQLKPVYQAGTAVGYIGLLPHKTLSDNHQLKFAKEQKLVFALTALVMLLVSAAISFPLARLLTRPLKKLAAATSHLSSGNYDVRVSVESNDEFGNLSRDFNSLALTLKKNEQARRQFMADISHELRTPLAILGGELEAIQDGLQDLSLESISSLQAELSRINRLVEDLYQLALSDIGALTYHKKRVNLNSILADAVSRMRPRFSEKGLTLDFHLPEADVFSFGDPERLSQLFDNLLDNSRKYTNQGGNIRASLQVKGNSAIIDIMDSEPGVSDDELARLFDRLYRVEGSRSRRSGGAGLGLAICKNIAEAHEGSIEALHSPSGGILMKIAIPLTGKRKWEKESL